MSDFINLGPEIRDKMRKIRETADAACDRAQADGVSGAINWADLGVVEVRFCIDEDGQGTYDVLIEEAAPGSGNLMRYVGDRIADICKPHSYEIRTEW